LAEPFFVLGVLALATGSGFVIASAAAYLLSRRMGLLTPARAEAHE
jgi:hypothetical protein